jgi:pectate lyase
MVVVQQGEQHVDRGAASRLGRHGDGGQRRRRDRGEHQVVEPHQADLVRHRHTAGVEPRQNTERDTDRPTYDVGKLRVTLHHNLFESLGSRAPRVRYGQVHVYNNLYVIPESASYEYSWGVGVESRLFAENDFFQTGRGVDPSTFVKWWKGTALHATGTLVNGRPVDVVAAHNAAFDPDLGTDVGWAPTLVAHMDPAGAVPRLVRAKAGVGRN